MTAATQATPAPSPEAAKRAIPQARDLLEEVILSSEDSVVRLEAYHLADARKRRELIRGAAIQSAELSWGSALNDVHRTAIVRWALEGGIDPLRHIDMLGGNVYINARYYYDRLASDGILRAVEVRLLAPLDTRAIDEAIIGAENVDRVRKYQQDVNAARLILQIDHGVPSEINEHLGTAAAALVTLHFHDGTTHEGINWAGSMGHRKKRRDGEGSLRDPVGDEHPVKTAVTRAFRKAAMQKVPAFRKDSDEGTAVAKITGSIKTEHERAKAQQARVDSEHTKAYPPGSQVAGVDGSLRGLTRGAGSTWALERVDGTEGSSLDGPDSNYQYRNTDTGEVRPYVEFDPYQLPVDDARGSPESDTPAAEPKGSPAPADAPEVPPSPQPDPPPLKAANYRDLPHAGESLACFYREAVTIGQLSTERLIETLGLPRHGSAWELAAEAITEHLEARRIMHDEAEVSQ